MRVQHQLKLKFKLIVTHWQFKIKARAIKVTEVSQSNQNQLQTRSQLQIQNQISGALDGPSRIIVAPFETRLDFRTNHPPDTRTFQKGQAHIRHWEVTARVPKKRTPDGNVT
jgi:hypothetical protein